MFNDDFLSKPATAAQRLAHVKTDLHSWIEIDERLQLWFFVLYSSTADTAFRTRVISPFLYVGQAEILRFKVSHFVLFNFLLLAVLYEFKHHTVSLLFCLLSKYFFCLLVFPEDFLSNAAKRIGEMVNALLFVAFLQPRAAAFHRQASCDNLSMEQTEIAFYFCV